MPSVTIVPSISGELPTFDDLENSEQLIGAPAPDLLAPAAHRCHLDAACDFRGTWQAYLDHAPAHPLPNWRNRAAWLDSRRTFVGASEVASVVGANPYAGPLEVWAAKVRPRPELPFTPRIVPGGGVVVKPNHEVGQVAEWPLLEDFMRRHRCTLVQPTTLRSTSDPFLAATPDGDVTGGPLVQVKKIGHRVDWVGDWDAGPPIYTLLQVQTEMHVWRRDRCIILVDIGELREYEVRFDASLIEPAIEIVRAFWPSVVEARAPVDFDLRASQSDTFKWLWPEAAVLGLGRAEEEMIRVAKLYSEARSQEKAGAEDKDRFGAQLKAMLGDAEGAFWGPSEKKCHGKVTWRNDAPRLDHGGLAASLLEKYVGDELEREQWLKRFTGTVGPRVLRVTVKGA